MPEVRQAGAPAAYRGYRLQALYTLGRMLEPEVGAGLIFQPEGEEDLDVLDSQGRLLEVVQVKSYASLVLSQLLTEKPGSFFQRAVELLNQFPTPPAIKLVNFGAIGNEMKEAWKQDGRHRKRVTRKLLDKGIAHPDIANLFEYVQLISVDESELRAKVFSELHAYPVVGDAENAFDLLNYWIYLVSEESETLTYVALIERVEEIGRYLAERQAHHREWFTSIVPLEDRTIDEEERASLREEFVAGIAARYEHILADLDAPRDVKLTQISEAFSTTNRVVIVHGASGQGKTTLALRYMHDSYPGQWRFCIETVENRQHALSISRALSGFADTLQLPMAVHLDVSPRDVEWPSLVRSLSRYPYLRILVTIREEDYRRANISGADFTFTAIDLSFEKAEAVEIYERIAATGPPHVDLDFEAAWHRFGGDGPLLEFIYLLNNTITLRERLQEQVNRIREEVRMGAHPDELQLLRLVATASAYSARLDTRLLINHLHLPEPDHVLKRYEKEYLIRLSEEDHWVEGLHPIRSQILAQLLLSPDLHPWTAVVEHSLPLILEQDLEAFLLHAFIDRSPERDAILRALKSFTTVSWTGVAGVLRALLWAGINAYINENVGLIEEAKAEFGSAWWIVLDLNFAGSEVPQLGEWWTTLGNLISQERQDKCRALREKQTPKLQALEHAAGWLSHFRTRPRVPSTSGDWSGLAETMYWAVRLEQKQVIAGQLPTEEIMTIPEQVPLRVIGELSLALHMFCPEKHADWLTRNESTIESRLALEYEIVAVEKRADRLFIHFLPSIESFDDENQHEKATGGNYVAFLHNETLERLRLVRHLFPIYAKYGSQGHGHKLGVLPLPEDSTEKEGVLVEYLSPNWAVRLNSIATGLGHLKFRPGTWSEYAIMVLERRASILACLQQLQRGLTTYLGRKKAVNILAEFIDSSGWQGCHESLGTLPKFPRPSVDPWGFADERTESTSVFGAVQQEQLPSAIALQKYRPFNDAQDEYTRAMVGFLGQAPGVMFANFYAGKLPSTHPSRESLIQMLAEHGVDIDSRSTFLSTYNLTEAKRSLGTYQEKYRSLFAHLVEDAKLVELEQQELALFQSVWPLWYYFANTPSRRIPHASSRIPRELAAMKQGVQRKVSRALAQTTAGGARVDELRTEISWRNSPTIWVTLSLNKATQLYEKYEVLILSLKKALGGVNPGELTYQVIRDVCEYIVVVPLVKDRMMNEFAWPLHVPTTILTEVPLDELVWSYAPQPLPQGMRNALGLRLWESPHVTVANEFSAGMAALVMLLSQIADLNDIPNVTEAGKSVLRDHVDNKTEQFHDVLLTVSDSLQIMAARLESPPPEEIEARENLREVLAGLLEIKRLLYPSGDSSGRKLFDMNAILDFGDGAAHALPIAEAVRLYWIQDSLEDSDVISTA